MGCCMYFYSCPRFGGDSAHRDEKGEEVIWDGQFFLEFRSSLRYFSQ